MFHGAIYKITVSRFIDHGIPIWLICSQRVAYSSTNQLIATRPGVEPATLRSRVKRPTVTIASHLHLEPFVPLYVSVLNLDHRRLADVVRFRDRKFGQTAPRHWRPARRNIGRGSRRSRAD